MLYQFQIFLHYGRRMTPPDSAVPDLLALCESLTLHCNKPNKDDPDPIFPCVVLSTMCGGALCRERLSFMAPCNFNIRRKQQ